MLHQHHHGANMANLSIPEIISGTDASGVPQSIVLSSSNVTVGDIVVSVVNLDTTPPTDLSASFESTISVGGQIQQTSTDLSALTNIQVVIINA